MPRQFITFDTEEYGDLRSCVPSQKVRLSLVGEVSNVTSNVLTIKIDSINVAYKSKLSTQEVLLHNSNKELNRIGREQVTSNPTP